MIKHFEEIRPYLNEEIPAAMKRISENDYFPLLASYVFPERNIEDVRKELCSYNTVRDFQLGVMYWVNRRIIETSITSFTCTGIENISSDKNYLYVSNHRDIMLDASLLQNVLTEHGHDTSEITFGANLMHSQVVVDIGKSNKMFKVIRPNGNIKEFYKSSLLLSEYIRYAINENKQSVWIAQRNGRTKNGIDRTDQGIIKMFGMSRMDDKVLSLAELNIVPVSVSYEWESCDILKTIELYKRQFGSYIKKIDEDLNSILTGVTQPKGRVHFEICKPIALEELEQFSELHVCDFHKAVANIIDERICSAYKLFPNNYISHDIIYGNKKYASYYTVEEKEVFLRHMNRLLEYKDNCDVEKMYRLFLGIYSNPIDSKSLFTNR